MARKNGPAYFQIADTEPSEVNEETFLRIYQRTLNGTCKAVEKMIALCVNAGDDTSLTALQSIIGGMFKQASKCRAAGIKFHEYRTPDL